MIARQYEGASASGAGLTSFYIEDYGVSIAVVVPREGLPRIVHWGAPLADGRESLAMFDAQYPQSVGGELDTAIWPSVLPTQAEPWFWRSHCSMSRDGVELYCRFVVGECRLDDSNGLLEVFASDLDQSVSLVWALQMVESGLLRQRVSVGNTGGHALDVNGIQVAFPIPYDADEVLSLSGRHLKERMPQRHSMPMGRFEKTSEAGRPDFDASLLLVAGERGFGFEHGRLHAISLAWSGNGAIAAEKNGYTCPILCGGELLHSGEISLEQGQNYATPWLCGTYGNGLNEASSRLHAHIRATHPNLRNKPRPVTLNIWEAVLFNHSPKLMRDLADKTAQVGVEHFIVDDGWFAGRRNDRVGLGDWHVDRAVYPQELHEVADYVHDLDMEFGLWFEPEMVNPDSDLFRKHPEWVLRPSSARMPMSGRSQQVLDLTNPQAYDYIHTEIDTLIGELGIDYIKWDHNRPLSEAISPYSGRPAVHEQTLAVWKLMDDLKAAHPGLEIESCASGGGRVDMGILEHVDRVWVSDCVDPLERADIQRGTSLLVPPEMMGQHVGAAKSFTTGRHTTDSMRMAMTLFGHMGVECNLTEVPEKSLSRLEHWIKMHRSLRQEFSKAKVVHGDTADPAVRIDGLVKLDRSHAWYRFIQLETSLNYPGALIRLPGLDPDATYDVKPMEIVGDMDDETGERGARFPNWWIDGSAPLSGVALGQTGIRPPQIYPGRAMVFEAIRCHSPRRRDNKIHKK